ncbi:sterol-sensing domain of SREBP cleavage-activation-domain-containing protein [Abortiporus biennis]|nr:sterol-sensing domain of SREBP cleavage-activation-domain-containing protein [Abortiporus biennis]
MVTLFNSVMGRVRSTGGRFFHQFGIHCATHQIRVILISAVVITSLLFPAIAIYSSSQTHFFALSLRVLDSFLIPDDISSYFAQHDIRHIWEGYDSLHVRDDSVARARCGNEGLLRSERLLVHSVSQDGDITTLSHQTLLSTLKLERRVSETLASHGLSCIRLPSGNCFALSPLAFWNYDDTTLMEDTDILDTLNLSRNVSVHGISINPEMVLAGRELEDSSQHTLSSAMFLVLTYFFPDNDCYSNAGHYAWLRALKQVTASDGDLVMQAQAPNVVALEYNVHVRNRFSSLSILSYAAYTAFFVYFCRSMRRMDTVHSRIGLAFTGIVEIIVSTVTSLSVCALVGFRITMIPWEIFPIVVIFIGVENMFSIVDAVVKTSIALPVKLRIAEGLSRAGTSNSLKLIFYNTVLGVIAGFSTGAIQQFCAFAIVVLVAHWFLIHTFFVTVLSIDIQRLELDELLRQGSHLAPSAPVGTIKESTKQPRSKLGTVVQHITRGRAAKNISLMLLLAITGTLYYATQPGTRPIEDSHKSLARNGRLRNIKQPIAPGTLSPASTIWQVFNPTNDALVHVRIESPSILVLGPEPADSKDTSARQSGVEYEKMHRSRWSPFWVRIMRPVVWVLKIVVVPMTVSCVLLYGLLLYLLKDAELLEAQRNRAEPDAPIIEENENIPPVAASVTFRTLPRAFATDVDMLSVSKDGSVVVGVGLQNELVVWRTCTQTFTTIDTSDLVLGSGSSTGSASTTITAVAVDDRGTFCAVGTGAGVISVWYIGKEGTKKVQDLISENTICAVTSVCFAPTLLADTGMSTPIRTRSPSQNETTPPTLAPGTIYSTYENGSVIQWTVASFAVPTHVTPSRSASVIKSMLLPVQADHRILVGFALDDGTLELCDLDKPDGILPQECCVLAGNPLDLVSQAHVCRVEFEQTPHLVIAAATHAGVVSLWDAHTTECMYVLDEPYGGLNGLKVTPVITKNCSTCGELPLESFTLSMSIPTTVVFYQFYLSVSARRCSCVHNQPGHQVRSSILGRRSRSASTSSTGTMTPTHSRSRISSFSSSAPSTETSMFPVSGHGVHSRRASDKEILRRNLDNFLASDYDESENHHSIGPLDSQSNLLATDIRSSRWQNLVVVRVADATFERGDWSVVDDNRIVGIRRRPRMPFCNGRDAAKIKPIVLPDSSTGLAQTALERWELWSYNPSDSNFQASALASLSISPSLSVSPSSIPHVGKTSQLLSPSSIPLSRQRSGRLGTVPRLHFTRVSPLVSGGTCCVAAFGNTVGFFNMGGSDPRGKHRQSLERLREVSNQYL